MVLASGSMVALPSWALGWRAGDISHDSSFTRSEQDLISAIADTIIPSDGTIGALSVGVDKFLIRLIEKCYDEAFQNDIKTQLHKLNAAAEKKAGIPFGEGTRKQREDLFLAFSTSGDEDENGFFEFMKDQTIRGFNTSEEVMVNYHHYVMMPGFYDGCVDV